jgi:CRP/FNR family transcriptional regulator/CRP/FNR family cyclic AMP-dependent transcriptional regulator
MGQHRREVIGVAMDRRTVPTGTAAARTTGAASTPGGAGSSRGQDDAARLAAVPLFSDLDAESLARLAEVARTRSFAAGATIFHRGDPGQVLYVIQRGKVKICLTSPEGQEVALAVLGPGECFGELALLDGQPRSADACALEPVVAAAIQRADFIKAAMQHPRIAVQIMQVLSRRLRQTDDMVQDLLFLDVHGRVAKKLLELGETHGVHTPEGIRIEMRLTQGELAAMVGASRESVNKVMGYLTEKRYITTDKHRITVTRLAELRRHL